MINKCYPFSIAKNSAIEVKESNEDRIGETSETFNKSGDNHIASDEGVTYDDEIKILG